VLNHLRDTGTDVVVPRLRESDRSMSPRPWIDDFSAGYIQRMTPLLPKQGERDPWIAHQDYRRERKTIGDAAVTDDVLRFERAATAAAATQ